MNKDIIVRITKKELMTMKAIELDNDKCAALAIVKLLIERIDSANKGKVKFVLD